MVPSISEETVVISRSEATRSENAVDSDMGVLYRAKPRHWLHLQDARCEAVGRSWVDRSHAAGGARLLADGGLENS